jgi:short-subunit dehydrogenase
VSVTALCPGPTRTGFQARAQLHGSRLKLLSMMQARPVAEAAYRGMMAGRGLVIPGLVNQLLAFSTRLGPRSWITRFSGLLARKGR